ncbi:MAG TPA: tetratricopeptide repeat protein, partial [Usitatibacter sp.]|nr:tetratricopeptide repeat protein [Usitatibacter sp.]
MFIRLFLPLVVALLGFHAAAFAQPSDDESALYDMLLGEIAQQRGDYALAAKTYLELARRTGDPRAARRAVEVANQGRLEDLALDAAKTWYELEPQSPAALSVVASLLVNARKVDEAQPYLQKLLDAQGVDLERGYLQLNRLLAGNPDKAANLRVVRNLAARHPEMAPAHLAIAQAATAANNDSLALAEARRAAELKPDWEGPAIFEAQILQKKSTA